MDIQKELNKERKKKKELIKKDLKTEIECGEKLAAMRGSPGWKYVEDYLTQEMESAMNMLLVSRELKDIQYSQAVVTVIRKLLAKIGVSSQLATNASEMLKKYK